MKKQLMTTTALVAAGVIAVSGAALGLALRLVVTFLVSLVQPARIQKTTLEWVFGMTLKFTSLVPERSITA